MAESYPKTVEERAKLYLHCMVEIKERLGLAANLLPVQGVNDLFKNEICSLQFRHICELIAIACLAAQGDFKTQKAFRESYSPKEIFNALRKTFASFFPEPSTITVTPGKDGKPTEHHLDLNSKPDAYGEADIVKLWNQSGDHLHRASVRKYLKKSFSPSPPLAPILRHLTGLARLLETHVIPIGEPPCPLMLDVRLADAEDNVVANFLTIDREAGTIQVATYSAKLTAR